MRIRTFSPVSRASKVGLLRATLAMLTVALSIVALAEIGFASASPSQLTNSLLKDGGETARFANPTEDASADLSVLAAATMFTVNTVDDADAGICDGAHCSLREAINAANDNTGFTDTIEFDISGDGPHRIRPESALPTITDPVVIDGYTQSGASENTNGPSLGSNAVLMIEIVGYDAGGGANGLHITAGDSTVKGLAINRFDNDGILIETNGGNVIEGNFIGTDVFGTDVRGNGVRGVEIRGGSQSNTIGGTSPGARNILSGNGHQGVLIVDVGTTGNLVVGNFIGTDVDGTDDFGNGLAGVLVCCGAGHNTIGGSTEGARNVLSGNDTFGVALDGEDGTGNNIVQGNYIGTDRTGTSGLGNSRYGVDIREGSIDNLIGGDATGEGNLISGNHQSGIIIRDFGSSNNEVLGNLIGTDVTGRFDFLGNNDNGIRITNAQDNIIGGIVAGMPSGPCTGACNVISGNNRDAIVIDGDSSGNVIQGNFIGPNVNGAFMRNWGNGVAIGDDAHDNSIGGTAVGAGNRISFNRGSGVAFHDSATGNAVLSNSMIYNRELGIDFFENG